MTRPRDRLADTWPQPRLPLEVRFLAPLADGADDDLVTDDWFEGFDELPGPEWSPTRTIDEDGNEHINARLTSHVAVGRALEHLLWAWQRGAVISFSIEADARAHTRIAIVYARG